MSGIFEKKRSISETNNDSYEFNQKRGSFHANLNTSNAEFENIDITPSNKRGSAVSQGPSRKEKHQYSNNIRIKI